MSRNKALPETTIKAWSRLLRTGQALVDRSDAALKAAGFPPLAWYDALLELERVGEPGLRPYHLQQEMLLAQYNMSRLADRLVKEGLVERRPCAEDGRGHVLVITAEGRALRKRMWPVYRDVIRSAIADRLTDPEIEALSGTLLKLSDNSG